MWPTPIRPTPRPLYCPATMVANTLRCYSNHAITHWCRAVWQWPIEIRTISWETVISSSAAAIYQCKDVHGNWRMSAILLETHRCKWISQFFNLLNTPNRSSFKCPEWVEFGYCKWKLNTDKWDEKERHIHFIHIIIIINSRIN